jgi:hypothetical protein
MSPPIAAAVPAPKRSIDDADALVAVAKSYLASASGSAEDAQGVRSPGAAGSPVAAADHYQVVVHVDEKALRGGARDGGSLSRGAGSASESACQREAYGVTSLTPAGTVPTIVSNA